MKLPIFLIRSSVVFAVLCVVVACGRGDEQQTVARKQAFFEKKIRPVLVAKCYECHSAKSDEVGGKLLLDSRDGILKGGESGPAVVAGKPDDSLIIQSLRYGDTAMPPDEPLPQAVINDFVTWVSQGAVDPRSEASNAGPSERLDAEALWSFAAVQPVTAPEVVDSAWAWDTLDQFVLAKIEAAGLQPTTDADARTLVRRLYYDLIGLPPTAEQIEAFEQAYSELGHVAAERLVDTLLASPQYGERWGRHWLDVARYGESNGDDGLGRNASFPHAWRYRDYVIDAFNNDVPYDRFITEQMAGDLMPADTAEERNRLLTATGFLAIGAKPASAMNSNFAMDIVDDQINVVCTAVMGLSVACARCHDHKHDPIPTADYYAMAGIFRSTETLYGLAGNEKLTAPPTALHELRSALPSANQKQLAEELNLPDTYFENVAAQQPVIHTRLNAPSDVVEQHASVSFSDRRFAELKQAQFTGKLSEVAASYSVAFWFRNVSKHDANPITAYLFSRAPLGDKGLPGDHLGIGGKHDAARAGKLFVFNGNATKQTAAGSTVLQVGSWNHVVLVRRGNRVKLFLNGVDRPEVDAELPATFGDCREFSLGVRSDDFAHLNGNLADFSVYSRALTDAEAVSLHSASGQPKGIRTLGLAMGVRDKKKIEDCKIHINGDGGKLGPVVSRGILTAYRQVAAAPAESAFRQSLDVTQSTSGRLELARWLTQPTHPQTARVMVNRIWLHLFGEGLVSTPDDFGVYGARPTHPELLDHLAERFVIEGWSVKRFIRAIVLSRTYQLDSRCSQDLADADPDNRLLARHHRRRLDAESLRDSLLHASGQLNLQPGQGSTVSGTDALINWPPGESTRLHQPSNHRSVYLCMLRHAPPPELAAFNLPDGVNVAGKRDQAVLPTQTLFLLNSSFVVEQAESLASSVWKRAEWSGNDRIREIFRRTLKRDPTMAEVQQSLSSIQSMAESLALTADDPQQKAWSAFCQSLLATNEFRYVD